MEEEEEKAIIQLKNGLTRDAFSQLRLYVYQTLDDVFHATVDAKKWVKDENTSGY